MQYSTKKEKLKKSLDYNNKMAELKLKTQEVLRELIKQLEDLTESQRPMATKGRGRPRKVIEIQTINSEDVVL